MADAADRTSDPGPTGRLRRRLWRLVRVLMLTLAFLLLLLLLMPWITNTGPVRGLVGRALAGRLRGARVHIDTLRVAPFRDEVFALEGVRVAPDTRPDEPALTLGRLAVHWRPAELLHRRLRLTSVLIESLRLDAREEADGWNILHLMPRPGKPAPPEVPNLPVDIQVDSLQVRDVELRAVAGNSLNAAVRGVSGEMACRLSGSIQGTITASMRAERATVQTPLGSVRLEQGLAMRASVQNSSKSPHLAGTLTVPQVVAEVKDLGATQPLPVGASLDAVVDLGTTELPQANVAFQVPGLVGEELTLSVKGGPEYTLHAHSSAAGDLGALLDALPSLARGPLRSLEAGGRALAVTDLDGSVSLKPRLRAYALLRQSVYASDVHSAAALRPAALTADVAGLRARLRQEVAIAFDGALGGLSVTDLSGGLGSVRVAAGPDATGELDGLDFDLTARAALPAASRVELAAHAAAKASATHPLAGKLALPLAGKVRVSGTDMVGPNVAAVINASGSVGGLVPAASVVVRAPALRTEPLALRACAALDVGRTVAMVSALPLLAKLPVESLRGTGAAGVELQADARPGSGLVAACVGAADVAGPGFGVKGLTAGAGRLQPAFALDLTADAGFLPRTLRTDSGLHVESLTAPLGVTLGGMDATVAVDWRASAPSVLHAVKHVQLTDLSVLPALAPISLEAGGGLTADAVAGDLSASKVQVSLGDLLSMSAPELKLTGFGAGLSGMAHAEVADLGRLLAFAADALPPALRAKLPTVSGRAAADLDIGGGVPLAERMAAALMHGRSPALPSVRPLAAFYRDNVPLNAKVHLAAEDVTALSDLSERLQAGVRGLRAEADVELDAGEMAASLQAELPEAVFTPSPLPLRDFRAQADMNLRGFDALSLQGKLSGLGDVLTGSAALDVEGLSRLPLTPSPADALRTLTLAAHADGSVRPGKLKFLEGLEASGTTSLGIDAALEPGRSLQVAFAPRLDEFAMSFRDLFSVSGLDGGFHYSKGWRITEAGRGAGAEGLSQRLVARPADRAGPGIEEAFPEFGTAVDELVDHAEQLSMASLSALGAQIVDGLNVRLLAGGASLLVPRFYMHLLGGRTVGTAGFGAAQGGRELRAQGEFAQVDFRRMLPADLRDFSGDSRISGNFALSALLAREPARSPLKEVSARLDLTHIGPVALDRLLLALDPRSTNPSIVRVRHALSLASPSRVSGRLQRGFLSGSVELRGAAGRLVSQYSIPPFNIAGLFGMRAVGEALGRLAPAMAALNLLDTSRIELEPDGRVRFR